MEVEKTLAFILAEQNKIYSHLFINLPPEAVEEVFDTIMVSSIIFSSRVRHEKALPNILWNKIIRGSISAYYKDPDNHHNHHIPVVSSEEHSNTNLCASEASQQDKKLV